MKKATLLLIIISLSTACFAQDKITIKDVCYDATENEKLIVNTYKQDEVVQNLSKKGFNITDTEFGYREKKNGDIIEFKFITMHQKSSNTTVTIGKEGAYTIKFNTPRDTEEFTENAISVGYFAPEQDWFTIINGPVCGITHFETRGRILNFSICIP